MKIKKTIKTQGAGGAAISDRLKLNAAPAMPAGATVGKGAATCALVATLLALAVAGGLAAMLWKHWEYLMPA